MIIPGWMQSDSSSTRGGDWIAGIYQESEITGISEGMKGNLLLYLCCEASQIEDTD